MLEQNKTSICSFEEMHTVCNALGVPITAKAFSQHYHTYAQLKQNYDTALNNYLSAHARDILTLSQQFMKNDKMRLPFAVADARLCYKKQFLSLLNNKQLSVPLPCKIKKLNITSPVQKACDISALQKKMHDWKNGHTNLLLLDEPAKELLRHCNFDKLTVLLNDLNIAKKDYARFKMNLSRYKGSVSDFLSDFDKKQLPYFSAFLNESTQKNKSTSKASTYYNFDKKEPSSQALIVPLCSSKKHLTYHLPSFTLSKKSLFNWLKGIKKCYKVHAVHLSDLKKSLNITLPKAKVIPLSPSFLDNSKKALKCAAIVVPFFALEFWGYKQACKAAVTPKKVDIHSLYTKYVEPVPSQVAAAFSFPSTDSLAQITDNEQPNIDIKVKKVKSKSEKTKQKNTKQIKTTRQPYLLDVQPIQSASAYISSNYGYRKHPFSGRRKMHTGVDIAAPLGTPVVAPADGVVRVAKWNGGYGKYVVIEHNHGLSTAYAHLYKYAKGIKPGTRVRKGQTIAYVGSTGISTGSHLHFETHLNDEKVDPRTAYFSRYLASR